MGVGLEAEMALALEFLALVREEVVLALVQEKVAVGLGQVVLVQEGVEAVAVAVALEEVAVVQGVLVLGQEGAELAVAVDREDYMEGGARMAS